MITKENGSVFGSYLKKLREKKKLKLNAVAMDLKIDTTLLSKYEGGTRFPKRDKFDLIVKYFNVNRNKLAEMIAKDKQRSHFQRLSSDGNTKINKRNNN
jgi:transcriptional regulator with XRE-family HTH domain